MSADFARSADSGVQAQLDRLAKLAPGNDTLGLERIRALLGRLGSPETQLPLVLHVAGTNGKGSTCAFLRAMLEASGRKVHMFTSPHLVRFNERIRLAGELVSDTLLADLLGEVLDSAGDIGPTFFEVTTAAALLAFARIPADACIVEVGLGGRLDATNVFARPLATAITALGFDHQQWLGRSLGDIAAEKAGIARPGVPLVTQLYPPAAASRVEEIAGRVGADWLPRGRSWDARVAGRRLRYMDHQGDLDLPLPRLAGRHQAFNAALAVAMLRHQDRLDLSPAAYAEGIEGADWPGRLQRLRPGPLTEQARDGVELWVDGGHNPSASRAVAAEARRRFADRPLVLLFASLAGKDAPRNLEPFRGLAAEVRCVPIPGHDHHRPDVLAALARTMGLAAAPYDTVEQALDGIEAPGRVLIYGSLYLAGQVLAANEQFPD